MGLMLNRCDSLQERQTQSSLMLVENSTKERAGPRYTPEKPFLASHDDSAKNTGFKFNKRTGEAIMQKLLCASFL